MSSGSSGGEAEQLPANGATPGERQLGEGELPRQAADRRRQHQLLGPRRDTRIEEMLLLVDVADRPDDGQDRRVAAEPAR